MAVIATKTNHGRIVVRPGATVDSPVALRGKRLTTLEATTAHFFAYRLLLAHGIRGDEVIFLLRRSVDQLRDDLLTGRADAASIWDPYAAGLAAELGPETVTLEAPDLVINRMMMVATPEAVQHRQDTVEALLRALHRAQVVAARNPAAAASRIAEYVGADLTDVKANWTPDTQLSVVLPQALLLELEEMARWAMAEDMAAQPMRTFSITSASTPWRRSRRKR